ncbi:sensor histidine kinase [Pseudoduganella umbonata]|uniref:histidine kinase n=1 Tax=Pseudoduganella umbonata TaxID=864828 RepID=A0A4P8HI37_9BURK|nr:hybrid sensor histidine kinase/response regulator [Pseudoduganella umbonata]MBB3224900.1 signal transduction histidine kinase [Pseudoduganella umbonata]QCP09183.1 hybrid sensor histidine kinase/response regulator [Pseudoduganella umbonata]
MTITLLLLDDNPDDRALARRELERHFDGCMIREVGDRAGFEREMQDGLRVDLIITDFQMRWITGLEILKQVRAYDAQLPVIMFTATGTQEIAVEAMKLGLDDYVIKSPRHYARLPVAVRTCLDRSEIRARAIRSETRLAGLLENIQLGVFRMSLDGRLQEGNRAFWTMLGGDPTAPDTLRHPLLDQVLTRLPALEATLDTTELQAELGAIDDAGRFFVVKLVRVKVNGHDVVDGIVEDATSLRRASAEILRLNAELEQRIVERTRQLQEANEALETFGFSVSHDLREPLRTIQGYAAALRQDLHAGDHRHLEKFVDRINAIARRIDQMVSDLLEFARLSRAEVASETLVLTDIVRDARIALQNEPVYRAAEVQVDIPEDLRVRAHRPILVQALTNLLGNAVKFVRPNTHAAINVVARAHGRQVRIEVQDNGIGLADEARARVFNVFERLHGEEEYPGTGIGLAIVKKGVERMDGCVGVDSAPGIGSTFWIELPSA